ncbi:MAG: PIN domain-containing protein [Defluviitaleaceae bacterium]|nr:PIN domain-containing protein [Defluviitaleaceae bacterium]MCL2261614.1 PIN domain-containing protein [Defluviitaleaceae bacterium]
MRIVDANVILRYVLDDHLDLSQRARKIIDDNIVEVPVEVLSEVVYVLSSVYNADRNDIHMALRNFFEKTSCILPHHEAILKGLEFFAENRLDFVDCLLVGYQCVEAAEIYTFDKKLQSLLSRLQ